VFLIPVPGGSVRHAAWNGSTIDRDGQWNFCFNSHPAGQRILLPKYQRSRRFVCLLPFVAVYSVGRLARLASSPSYATGPHFSGNGAKVARVPHEHEMAGGGTRSRY